MLSGQFTGADDLVTKSGKAEFKRAAILVQQHARNVKAAFCLFLRQALPEILGKLACAVCNKDHIRILKKYVNRIKHVHLKDVRKEVLAQVKEENKSFLWGVRSGMFTVPGDGCIDFKEVYDVLKENNYEGWTMVEAEQDPAIANPLEYAIKARKYITEASGL